MDKRESRRRIVGGERESLAAEYARKYEAGSSIRSIAAESGRSYGFVHRVLAESGVLFRARGGDTKRRNPN
jgi:predicted transcriptional regulator